MIRACIAVVAAFVTLAAYADSLLAQAPAPPPAPTVQPPPMTTVLAGKNFTPPLRGEAAVEYTAPQTKRSNEFVVTRIVVRNASTSPIARLSVEETWYDKENAVITAGKGTIPGLLQPGEIQTVVIETPFRQGMNANNFTFTHGNGTVKPTRVPKLDVPKPAPAAAQK
jgi:hypothetical protein